MSFKLEFYIPGLPKMTNRNIGSWRARHGEALKWKKAVVKSVPAEAYKVECLPLKKAQVSFIRHSCKEPDWDGLVSGFKHVLDGLKLAGVIVDDKPSVIGQPKYAWEYAPQTKGFITVRVEEIVEDVGLGRFA